MKNLFPALALALAAMSGSALAADPATAKKPLTPQQEKMSMCQKSATDSGKTGPDRQAVVNECLKAKPTASAKTLTPQQEKMGTCQKTATASGKTGAERKAVLDTCLKKAA